MRPLPQFLRRAEALLDCIVPELFATDEPTRLYVLLGASTSRPREAYEVVLPAAAPGAWAATLESANLLVSMVPYLQARQLGRPWMLAGNLCVAASGRGALAQLAPEGPSWVKEESKPRIRKGCRCCALLQAQASLAQRRRRGMTTHAAYSCASSSLAQPICQRAPQRSVSCWVGGKTCIALVYECVSPGSTCAYPSCVLAVCCYSGVVLRQALSPCAYQVLLVHPRQHPRLSSSPFHQGCPAFPGCMHAGPGKVFLLVQAPPGGLPPAGFVPKRSFRLAMRKGVHVTLLLGAACLQQHVQQQAQQQQQEGQEHGRQVLQQQPTAKAMQCGFHGESGVAHQDGAAGGLCTVAALGSTEPQKQQPSSTLWLQCKWVLRGLKCGNDMVG